MHNGEMKVRRDHQPMNRKSRAISSFFFLTLLSVLSAGVSAQAVVKVTVGDASAEYHQTFTCSSGLDAKSRASIIYGQAWPLAGLKSCEGSDQSKSLEIKAFAAIKDRI